MGRTVGRNIPRTLQRLTALSVSRAKEPGYLADGGGLYLQITAARTKSWIYRFMLANRRREMGLGPYPAVSLGAARKAAADARSLVKAGRDPIDARKAERKRKRLDEAKGTTFDEAAEQFITSNEAAWRSAAHRAQWRISLATYASPIIGSMAVEAVGVAEIIRILKPLWQGKVETASRLRGRIERVLDWARVHGLRTGENPARWRGHLDKLLPALAQVHKVKHFAAVPIDEVASIYARLCESKAMSAVALRFAILTAARAGEATGLKWSEIDMKVRVWTVPADRIKAGRDHRVPLSDEAMRIVVEMRKVATGNLVFPGWVNGRPLALKSLRRVLKTAGGGSATVHGFRSTFRDWASERTNYSRDVAEMALAHAIGDKVEAAYRRGDLFERRKAMMQDWANFVCLVPSEKVVSIIRRRA
jgi:integrase